MGKEYGVFKKFMFLLAGLLAVIVLFFAYQHFLKVDTYQVDQTVIIDDENHEYQVQEVVLQHFKPKDGFSLFDEIPWYFQLRSKKRIEFFYNIHRFFPSHTQKRKTRYWFVEMQPVG